MTSQQLSPRAPLSFNLTTSRFKESNQPTSISLEICFLVFMGLGRNGGSDLVSFSAASAMAWI